MLLHLAGPHRQPPVRRFLPGIERPLLLLGMRHEADGEGDVRAAQHPLVKQRLFTNFSGAVSANQRAAAEEEREGQVCSVDAVDRTPHGLPGAPVWAPRCPGQGRRDPRRPGGLAFQEALYRWKDRDGKHHKLPLPLRNGETNLGGLLKKHCPLFGSQDVPAYDRNRPLILSEGAGTALKFREVGAQAVALLGAGHNPCDAMLIPVVIGRDLILARDQDDSGVGDRAMRSIAERIYPIVFSVSF